jgi:hypothetical protein
MYELKSKGYYLSTGDDLYRVLMEKEAGAFSRTIRGYIKRGEVDKANRALQAFNLRSGGGVKPSSIHGYVQRAGEGNFKDLNAMFGRIRTSAKKIPSFEDFVPRTIGGKVNPV